MPHPRYYNLNLSEERSTVEIVWKASLTAKDTSIQPFKDEAQTALFKDPVRTAL
jgi:hypothetical protein